MESAYQAQIQSQFRSFHTKSVGKGIDLSSFSYGLNNRRNGVR